MFRGFVFFFVFTNSVTFLCVFVCVCSFGEQSLWVSVMCMKMVFNFCLHRYLSSAVFGRLSFIVINWWSNVHAVAQSRSKYTKIHFVCLFIISTKQISISTISMRQLRMFAQNAAHNCEECQERKYYEWNYSEHEGGDEKTNQITWQMMIKKNEHWPFNFCFLQIRCNWTGRVALAVILISTLFRRA